MLSKYKDRPNKNGKLDSSKREKDVKKISKSGSSSASSSKNSKDKVKQNSSSNGKRLEDKRRSLSLSHADLFGDESPEEAEPIDVDDDDEEPEEVLVRKSADALKRGRLNKRKASELTPSSSEDEGDHGEEGSVAGKDVVDDIGIDFSSFQDDLDFDSDPMEECLRIFNESKDVKREDKGRQAKQVSLFLSCHTLVDWSDFANQLFWIEKNPLFSALLAFQGFRGGEKHREHFNHSFPRSKEKSLPFCCQRKCKCVTLTSLSSSIPQGLLRG